MSDLAETYYNAWVEVMGAFPCRLFCSWHIDNTWQKNIMEKIQTRQKESYAYKLVRTLMEERDITTFNKILSEPDAE